MQRLAEYRPALLQGEVYPLAFIWRTDYWTTITNILQDAMRRRRPEGVLDAAKDFMLDRLDDALEPLARSLTGKTAWGEMKENALAASTSQTGAARMVVDLLARLPRERLEIHLVGHSAGSILHAPLVKLLGERGLPIESCTLWAPACTVELFRENYLPAIEAKAIKRFSLFVLDDATEQGDNCASIYNKSLLYLVSDAFEDQCRIPGFREGVPLLGMEKCLDARLLALVRQGTASAGARPQSAGDRIRVWHPKPGTTETSTTIDHTVASTFAAIVGHAPDKDAAAPATLQFRRSASSLREPRVNMDARTAVDRGR